MTGTERRKRLKLGVIGVGRIGRLHARNLAQRVEEAALVALADVQLDAAQRLAQELDVPPERVYDDPLKLIDDGAVEAVVICSPTETHAALVEAAARARKPAFCEKPLDLDLQRIDRALEAVERAGVQLQVGFNRRFDPTFRAVREAVRSGEVGEPQLLRITSRDPELPPLEYLKTSGGLFLDMTIHDFDLARYLMGREVERVYAQGRALLSPRVAELGDVDTAVVVLEFEGGALGVIDNSRRAVYGYDQRVEVFGSKGVALGENPLPHQRRLGTAGGFSTARLYEFFLDRYAESYVEEMRAFVRCVLEGEEPPVTGRDGRVAVVLGLAAQTSMREGRPVAVREV